MNSLSANWITETHIDFEYKKYLLLGYLQKVSENFTESKLYPSLSQLVTHYQNVVAIRNNKKNLYDSFPDKLTGADLSGFRMIYQKILNDDQIMQEIESILDFSIPQFEKYIAEGRAIYDFIESRMSIAPVGIIPLHANEGYLLLKYAPGGDTLVYEYHITIFEGPEEKYRGISTQYLCAYSQSIHNTFENIKQDLIKYHLKLPNPATYVIESDLQVPLQETLLPLAKRTLVKFVAAQTNN
ncbi:MAG: hypothetical protein IPP71_04325 [Bacteroidetes bacterium]|nr:hypothetical protein [Bacteroidota bacterium]